MKQLLHFISFGYSLDGSDNQDCVAGKLYGEWIQNWYKKVKILLNYFQNFKYQFSGK